MKNTIKLRAKIKDGVAVVRMLIRHPMSVEGVNKKTGKKTVAHFIEKVEIARKGKVLVNANWGQAVSKNPYVSFTLTGVNKGDMLSVKWSDNQGNSDAKDVTL